jgi:hypothetical protein
MNTPDPVVAAMTPQPSAIHPAVKGAFKSKTMWAAGIFTTLCELEPVVEPFWIAAVPLLHLDPNTVRIVGLVAGCTMAVFRALTTNSLSDKGAPAAPPAAAP